MALTDGLVSYYKLDSNSNTSVGTNNGTDTAMSYATTGKIGNGATFNGSTSKVEGLVVPNTGAGPFTVNFWFKAAAIATNNVLFAFGAASAGRDHEIYFNSGTTPKLSCNFYGGGGVAIGTTTLSTGTWYMGTSTYDGTNLRIYLNGVLETTGANYTANIGTTYSRMGADSTGTANYLNGMVDEVEYYNRALSGAEITQLYNGGAGNAFPFRTTEIYATWNPADKEASITLSNGNLTATSGTTLWRNVRATIGKSTGKWYWELKTIGGTIETMAAIASSLASLGGTGGTFPGSDAYGYTYYGNGGSKYHSNTGVAYGTSFTTNDVIGVALDMDAGTLTFYKNGVSQGQAYSGISGIFYPFLGLDASGQSVVANFGATAFSYPVPVGYTPGIYNLISNNGAGFLLLI